MALFDAHELACQRGERLLFLGLDFRLAAGEALLLTGANGSGKSSLLRLAAGLSRPAAGEFRWQGRAITEALDQHHRRCLYLGHADAVKPGLTVSENLRFWADLAGMGASGARDAVANALDYFLLSDLSELPGRFLSAGQKRRLGLARLLLRPARDLPLWLLDEPTTALDAVAQQRLMELLLAHLQAGGLIICASHEALGIIPGERLPVDRFQPDALISDALTPDALAPDDLTPDASALAQAAAGEALS